MADIVERFQHKDSRPYIEMNGAVAIVTEEIFNTEIITQTCAEGHPNRDNLLLLVIKGKDI